MNPLERAFRTQFGDDYPTRRAEAASFNQMTYSYSEGFRSSSIARASRNALILRWLASCSPTFLAAVVAARACVLHCPIAEIDPTFQGPDEIDWLWAAYHATIQLFADDEL